MAEENTAVDNGESENVAPPEIDESEVSPNGDARDKKSNGEDTGAPNWRDAVAEPDMRKIAERFNTVGDAMKAFPRVLKVMNLSCLRIMRPPMAIRHFRP